MTNPVPPPPMPIPPPPGGTAISASKGSSPPPSQAVSTVPPPPPSGQALQSAPSPERLLCTLTASDVQLYEGSDAETYNELLEKISATVRPKDIVERIWISDVVYHQMEIHKLRRLKANLPKAAMPNALVDMFSLVANPGNWHSNRKDDHNLTAAEMLVRDWYRHKCPAIDNAAEYRPTQPDLSAEPIKARAFANELANLSRIDHLMASAEARRDASLQAIQRRRATFAENLRDALHNVEDAEFETIEPKEKIKEM